jgi:hypothetical protein
MVFVVSAGENDLLVGPTLKIKVIDCVCSFDELQPSGALTHKEHKEKLAFAKMTMVTLDTIPGIRESTFRATFTLFENSLRFCSLLESSDNLSLFLRFDLSKLSFSVSSFCLFRRQLAEQGTRRDEVWRRGNESRQAFACRPRVTTIEGIECPPI